MYSEILSRVKTSEEKEQLQDEIEALKVSLYERGAVFEDMLKTRVRAWASQQIRKDLEGGEIDKEKYLTVLIEKLKEAKCVKLSIAFEPTQVAIDKFYTFITGEIGENVVLDITCQPKIMGGAIIIYEGKYRNFSLRRVFEEESKTFNEFILKILAR